MKKLLNLSLILALFAGVGCDSNDDDDAMTDAEAFVGTWSVTQIRNDASGANQDITSMIFGDEGSVEDDGFVFTFNQNGTYSLMVDYKSAEATDLMIPPPGVPASVFTYTITPSASTEGEGTLRLQLPNPGGQGTVQGQAGYEIASETEMTALIHSALMNQIFGSQLYSGTVAVEFEKQ